MIRRKHFVDGMSQRAIAKELGHSRKFVKKTLQHPIPLGYRLAKSKPKPMLDPVIPRIDAWLEEDLTRPVKQRHTGQRIYERLVDEEGYQGSASTIRRYVARWREGRNASGKEVFAPLEFRPGEESQVDWGEAWIIQNGRRRKVPLFCMKCCYSKRVFVRAYDRANQESFLDGHVRAFEAFGGLTKRIAYDNLKSAVIQVGRGRHRQLNQKFVELKSWYLFGSRFCNVARGNEKGHVENLVKRAQRTFLTPLPEVTDLAMLNRKLQADCEAELERTTQEGISHRKLWEEEKQHLLPLPAQQFAACVERPSRLDKQSLAHFDSRMYSVPVHCAHRPCLIRGFVDRVEIHVDGACVAVHPRWTDRKQRYVLDPRHYLRLLERKPGLLDQARPFRDDPFGPEFSLLRRELEYRYEEDGTRQYIDVLMLLAKHPEEAVIAAVRSCVERRIFSRDAVLHTLHGKPQSTQCERLDLAHRPDLADCDDGIRSSAIYDQLREEEVAA
ncbi:MAG: IS21 family transposase [Pirellulales bacterium]|nr:IS21 family transposase [Pirellulales bacterium]